MSQRPSMRGEAAVRRGPYGPNNPPPPPTGPPPQARSSREREDADVQRSRSRRRPNFAVRRREYAQAEGARAREQDRGRSRSPVRHREQDRRDDQDARAEHLRYRERSPLRREPVEVQPRREERGHDKADSRRCFACNELGHVTADCKVAQKFDRKGCFRCGETGHIARACKVRVGQIKTDAEVAADESNGHANRYEERDVDGNWSPKQGYADRYENNHGFEYNRSNDSAEHDIENQHRHGQDQDMRQPLQDRSSMAPSRAGYYVEDEVDWDDDALETVEMAPHVRKSADRKMQQPERPMHEQPHHHERPEKQNAHNEYAGSQIAHHERPGTQNAATQDAPVQSTHRKSSRSRRPSAQKPAQEPRLGLPHFQNAKKDDFPPTVYDLRGYDHRIFSIYASKPKPQQFLNGANGKVAPGMYGSEQRHDFGLCFSTFLTRRRCEMGVDCPWRHHPLSNSERAWIVEYGKQKGKEFIDNMDRWWSFPEVPVPGATMQGLGDEEN